MSEKCDETMYESLQRRQERWSFSKAMRMGACFGFFVGAGIGLPFVLPLPWGVAVRYPAGMLAAFPIGLIVNYMGFAFLSLRFEQGSLAPVSIVSMTVLFAALWLVTLGAVPTSMPSDEPFDVAAAFVQLVAMLVVAVLFSLGNMVAGTVARWVAPSA
jgi:hypothetical protein